MVSLSFSFSYASMIAIVVFLLIIIVSLMYNFKSPMRKWVCFSLSAVSIFYLLYIMLWHEGLGNGQKIDWYLLGCVGVVASLGLACIGLMDLMKPVTQPELVEEPLVVESLSSKDGSEDSSIQDLPAVDNTAVAIDSSSEKNEDMTHKNSETNGQKTQEEKDKEAAARYAQLKDYVMPWFYDELKYYNDKEQKEIRICAEKFGETGLIIKPKIAISDSCNHDKIIEFCSIFHYFGWDNSKSIKFIKTIFKQAFSKNADTTIDKKIKGVGTIQARLDDYWEAKKNEKEISLKSATNSDAD